MAALVWGSAQVLPLQRPCRAAGSSSLIQRAPVRGLGARRPCHPASRLIAAAALDVEESESVEAEIVEPEFATESDGVGLTTNQVETLLSTICKETSILDLNLQMGSFSLKVRRSRGEEAAAAAAAPRTAAASAPSPQPTAQPVYLPTASFDFPPPQPTGPPSYQASQQSMGAATMSQEPEELAPGITMVYADKVGFFQTRRIRKHKTGKSLVGYGDVVKKGQVIGFINQLGEQAVIESPVAGMITCIFKDEDMPVEYGEVLYEIGPDFSGHIIGDSKHK